ncbi:YheC/YheD family endospore coat-associated protein [Paenibacillus puerhi]|uniref:YheC/YheD family endospore coat-associated protein n=1 Tax=Paenibacillus puerhi TaxID=2692622 RepID=UPI00135A9997|nr:YheC/YheD family protein [Paenibacillus puerhi]
MGKQLGVLAMYMNKRHLEELSFFRKLCIIGERLGLEVLIFTPDDVHQNGTMIHTLTYRGTERRWVRKWSKFPPIIYDRCRYHGAVNFRKLSHFRKKYTKLRYISKPLANKWKMHQLLSEHPGIAPHLPATIRYREPRELGDFLKKHAVVYMKPKSGTGGRGIIRLQRVGGIPALLMQGRDPARRIIPARKITVEQIPLRLAGWKLNERYIVQQGIPLELKDGRVHDFRMLVQKDGDGEWQVTGCAGRIGPRQSVTSNLHGGGTAVAMETLLKKRFSSEQKVSEIRNEAYELGLRIALHLEKKFGPFCEAGLDLAVDPKGHVWLLEVNPKPSREVFNRIGEKETYRRAISRPLEYALWLIR